MTDPRPIQWQLDHLEFPDGGHASAGGPSGKARCPPHRWAPVRYPATWFQPAHVAEGVDYCPRCETRRYAQGDAQYSYQVRNRLGLLAGSEPRCTKARRAGR